jgi:hypothetical protein
LSRLVETVFRAIILFQIDCVGHSAPAMPAMPHRQNLPFIYLHRLSADERALLDLRSQV